MPKLSIPASKHTKARASEKESAKRPGKSGEEGLKLAEFPISYSFSRTLGKKDAGWCEVEAKAALTFELKSEVHYTGEKPAVEDAKKAFGDSLVTKDLKWKWNWKWKKPKDAEDGLHIGSSAERSFEGTEFSYGVWFEYGIGEMTLAQDDDSEATAELKAEVDVIKWEQKPKKKEIEKGTRILTGGLVSKIEAQKTINVVEAAGLNLKATFAVSGQISAELSPNWKRIGAWVAEKIAAKAAETAAEEGAAEGATEELTADLSVAVSVDFAIALGVVAFSIAIIAGSIYTLLDAAELKGLHDRIVKLADTLVTNYLTGLTDRSQTDEGYEVKDTSRLGLQEGFTKRNEIIQMYKDNNPDWSRDKDKFYNQVFADIRTGFKAKQKEFKWAFLLFAQRQVWVDYAKKHPNDEQDRHLAWANIWGEFPSTKKKTFKDATKWYRLYIGKSWRNLYDVPEDDGFSYD